MHTSSSHSSKSELSPLSPDDLNKLAKRSLDFPLDDPSIVNSQPYRRAIKRRITHEERKEIVERRQTGESAKVLSEDYGISESAVRDLITNEEVQFKDYRITPEDIDQAVELYESGLTVKQVVIRLCYPIGTIRRVLREKGVVMRRYKS